MDMGERASRFLGIKVTPICLHPHESSRCHSMLYCAVCTQIEFSWPLIFAYVLLVEAGILMLNFAQCLQVCYCESLRLDIPVNFALLAD